MIDKSSVEVSILIIKRAKIVTVVSSKVHLKILIRDNFLIKNIRKNLRFKVKNNTLKQNLSDLNVSFIFGRVLIGKNIERIGFNKKVKRYKIFRIKRIVNDSFLVVLSIETVLKV